MKKGKKNTAAKKSEEQIIKKVYTKLEEMPFPFHPGHFKKDSSFFEKKESAKKRREDPKYIKTFLREGNRKLTDVFEEGTGNRIAMYSQFNIPARKTCPNATKACLKFCYARRDERFRNVRENRSGNLAASKENDFVDRMIYTIETELETPRFSEIMLLRIHESGDFYSLCYLKKWIDVFNHFYGRNVIFQFYTKSFDFILVLDPERKEVLRRSLKNHNVAISLSIDETTKAEDLLKIAQIKKEFPNINIYFAIDGKKVDSISYDKKCDCKDCSKCANCTFSTGITVVVPIH